MIYTAVLVWKFLINLRFKQLGDIPNFNHLCYCLKILHWVHHANRIQDDLRKSLVKKT